MRILIDTKDLINIVEHDYPITARDFGQWLHTHKHELVYTMTNISELAAPLRDPRTDILKMRGLLHTAAQLPHLYLKEGTISRNELNAAIKAFREKQNYEPPNPYVRRWDDTLVPDGESPLFDVVNLTLWDIIDILRKQPDTLLHSKRHSTIVINGINNDRALPATELRTPRQNFPYTLRAKIPNYQDYFTERQMDEFAKWLYARPQNAPGHRKSYETYHAIRGNTTDKLAASDVPDNAHIYALPYVDVATMDRRMTAYITQVQRQLNKSYPSTPVTPVYPNIKALMDDITP